MNYQITHVRYEPGAYRTHERITQVHTAGGTTFRVPEVVERIDGKQADFWVRSPTGGKTFVETYRLSSGRRHIRTEGNGTDKDNLNSLPTF